MIRRGCHMSEFIRLSAAVIELAGAAVILAAAAASAVNFLLRLRREPLETAARGCRTSLGRGILIALELLIAADILKSVVIHPTLHGLAVLAGIVAIRTFLSLSLDVEINGHWPWERARLSLEGQGGRQAPCGPPEGSARSTPGAEGEP